MKCTFWSSDLIARLGGDEFVVLFIGSNRETSSELMVRLERAAEESNRNGKRGYDILFSHGMKDQFVSLCFISRIHSICYFRLTVFGFSDQSLRFTRAMDHAMQDF